MEELVKLLGVEHQFTLQYSKEESAIVERANKEVMRHLRAMLLDANIVNEWYQYLPLVQRIMNASVHSALKLSPAQLLFGNAVTLDRGIFVPHERDREGFKSKDKSTELSEWAQNMLTKQAELMKIAQQSQKSTDDFHMSQSVGEHTEFPVNSYVLVQYRDRPPTKFHTQWEGPLRVVNVKKNTYTLQNLVTLKTRDVHVTQLKPFRYDATEINPVDIARKEAQEFQVESILQHRGGPRRTTTLEFYVKWAGYDESYDSWEPWENVKDNEVLNNYLYNNKLRTHLTKEQRTEIESKLPH